VFLEANVIKKGNETIRDLLLTKPYLIPIDLLEDAGRLIQHYDRWLEEFERLRLAEKPDLDTPFAFVGPAGFPFPQDAEEHFKSAFLRQLAELRVR
jgi:hypothetical protein